ncbi:MAG: hypothetical protein ACK5V3_16115 [Bdellovibrionales bacterium]
MKILFYTTILILFSQLVSSVSLARKVESLTATGYSSGYCQGDAFAQMCYRQIEDQSEFAAKRDLDIQCRMKNGYLNFFGFCNKYCSPLFLQPGVASFVNCSTRCTYDCEIREN